ncbi:MAG: heavy metal-associated domain-containing protein, partial [Gemmatimonadota bacterium]
MATIHSALERAPGFEGMDGSPISRRLEVRFDQAVTDAESLRRVIGDLGYRALRVGEKSAEPVRIWRSRRAILTYVAGAFFAAGIAVRLYTGQGIATHVHGFGTSPGLSGLLFLCAAGIGAWNFIPKAVGALRAGVLESVRIPVEKQVETL